MTCVMYDISCNHCGLHKYGHGAVKECPSCKDEDIYCVAEFDEPPEEHPEAYRKGNYNRSSNE